MIDESNLEPCAYRFVCFNRLSDEDYSYNKSIAEREFIFAENSFIEENSLFDINSQYQKFIPVFMIILTAVLIGVISYSTISVLKTKRSNSIFYHCGATRFQCFAITLIKGILIFITAAIFGVIIYFCLSNMQIPQKLGIRLMKTNIYTTLLLILFIFAVYSVSSFIVFTKNRRASK